MTEDTKPKRFTFFESYYEAAQIMDDEERGRFYHVLMDYAFMGIEPTNEDKLILVAFLLVKPNVDSSIKRSKVNADNASKTSDETVAETVAKTNVKTNGKTTVKTNPSKDKEKERDRDEEKEAENFYPTDNKNSLAASDGADAVKTAPPSAGGTTPLCPECDSTDIRLLVTEPGYRCACGNRFDRPKYEVFE